MSAARPTAGVQVLALRGERAFRWPETVVGEEPLEIKVAPPAEPASKVSVTMRTPGNDFELAVGFLLTEGIVPRPSFIRGVRYCLEAGEQRYNVVSVDVAEPVELEAKRRQHLVSASCGVCGTSSIEELEARCERVGAGPLVSSDLLFELPDRLRDHQALFERTGAIHAAGLFSATGVLWALREDIGRHNAVDKLLGWAALQGRWPLEDAILVVSGRVSFEIVQKAAVARIPIVVAVSAPSSLAIKTAERLGMTLVAFVRERRANVYAGSERVVLSSLARA
jgi:FdhD protein